MDTILHCSVILPLLLDWHHYISKYRGVCECVFPIHEMIRQYISIKSGQKGQLISVVYLSADFINHSHIFKLCHKITKCASMCIF